MRRQRTYLDGGGGEGVQQRHVKWSLGSEGGLQPLPRPATQNVLSARVNKIVTSPGDYSEDVDVPEDVVMHVRTLNLDSDHLVRLRDQPDPVDLAQGGGGDGEAGGVQVAEHGAHRGAQLRLDHLVSCVVTAASY